MGQDAKQNAKNAGRRTKAQQDIVEAAKDRHYNMKQERGRHAASPGITDKNKAYQAKQRRARKK